MTRRVPPPGELERAFARAHEMQAELARREQAVGRRIQTLARGLAAIMEPGDFSHRIGVGLHAFEVDGQVCLAASYLRKPATNTATGMPFSAVVSLPGGHCSMQPWSPPHPTSRGQAGG